MQCTSGALGSRFSGPGHPSCVSSLVRQVACMFSSVTSDLLDNLCHYFSDMRLGSVWGGPGIRRLASCLYNYVGREGPCWTRGAAASESICITKRSIFTHFLYFSLHIAIKLHRLLETMANCLPPFLYLYTKHLKMS